MFIGINVVNHEGIDHLILLNISRIHFITNKNVLDYILYNSISVPPMYSVIFRQHVGIHSIKSTAYLDINDIKWVYIFLVHTHALIRFSDSCGSRQRQNQGFPTREIFSYNVYSG